MMTVNSKVRWKPIVTTICALILVLMVGIVGMVRDIRQMSESIQHGEIAKFRSHAERTVSRLESEMGSADSLTSFVDRNPEWFARLWNLTVQRMPEILYGAVFSSDMRPLASCAYTHSNNFQPQFVQNDMDKIPDLDQGFPQPEIGPGVVFVPASDTIDRNVLDFTYPIQVGRRVVGFYRAGMDFDELRLKTDAAYRKGAIVWFGVMSVIGSIVFAACISLYRLGKHTASLQAQLGNVEKRRIEELHQLIIGIAHEIRNPLNAIRLNLFASKKLLHSPDSLNADETRIMLDESAEEIERMNLLVGQLLGYARVAIKQPSIVDVNQSVTSVASFLTRELQDKSISLTLRSCASSPAIRIAPASFRQVLINLIKNASQSINEAGQILITIESIDQCVRVAIHDSGEGVDVQVASRIFEPFFTTRENGVGMGLAVVKGLVEIADGEIDVRRSQELSGAEFHISFPLATLDDRQ